MKNRHSYTRTPHIWSASEIKLIEESCRIVADTLSLVEKSVKPGITTLELDKIAEDYILSKDAKPAFKGYNVGGVVFPNTLCISIDEQVIHGIPNDRKLDVGQIVSVDCGCVKNGFYGDSALTVPVGEISEEKKKLLRVTEESLMLGLAQAIDKNRVFDISRAVQEYVESYGFSVPRELTGHGIGKRLHDEPSIPNFVPALLYRQQFPNVKLTKGMAIAIEPMVHAGVRSIKTLRDGWTIVTADGKPAAHFEHTVIVDEGKPLILTLRN